MGVLKFNCVLNRNNAKALENVSKTVHNDITRLFKAGMREFVRVAAFHLSEGIDTGMSMASLDPLAKKLRLGQEIAQYLTQANEPKFNKYNPYGPFKNITGHKSKAHGRLLGQEAFDFDFGTNKRVKMFFKFQIVVFQHYLNDNGYAVPSRYMFQSVQRGGDAMLAFIESNATKYVSVNRIISQFMRGNLKSAKLIDIDGEPLEDI
jgi:hypothetical protein